MCVCVFPLTEESELALNAGITYYVAYLRFIKHNIELTAFLSGNDNIRAVIRNYGNFFSISPSVFPVSLLNP